MACLTVVPKPVTDEGARGVFLGLTRKGNVLWSWTHVGHLGDYFSRILWRA